MTGHPFPPGLKPRPCKAGLKPEVPQVPGAMPSASSDGRKWPISLGGAQLLLETSVFQDKVVVNST